MVLLAIFTDISCSQVLAGSMSTFNAFLGLVDTVESATDEGSES